MEYTFNGQIPEVQALVNAVIVFKRKKAEGVLPSLLCKCEIARLIFRYSLFAGVVNEVRRVNEARKRKQRGGPLIKNEVYYLVRRVHQICGVGDKLVFRYMREWLVLHRKMGVSINGTTPLKFD